MARIRSIKPEFFTSRKIARLPITARLTFIGLWTHVDDAGRCPDEPRLIKAAVWPLDDKHTVAKVEADLKALAKEGRIIRYTSSGERFLAVVGWGHQRIDKPRESDYPSPPNPGGIVETSSNDPGDGDEGSSASRAPADRIGSGRDPGSGDPEPSSSNHHGVAPPSADDDGEAGALFDALTDRRIARCPAKGDPVAYRRTVRASVVEELEIHVRRMLAEGARRLDVLDALEPLPGVPPADTRPVDLNPYPTFEPQPEEGVMDPDEQRRHLAEVRRA